MMNGFEKTNETFGVAVAEPQAMVNMDTDFIGKLTAVTQSFCSFNADTEEKRKALFKGMNQPDKILKDCVNEVIELKDLYIEVVELTNEDTGEVQSAPRIVLFDKDGVSYQCVSLGIYNCLRKLFMVFGSIETWKKPLKVKVKQVSKKANRTFMTLELAE